MLYAGLDLSRKRLDFHLRDGEGATVEVGAAPPDLDGVGFVNSVVADFQGNPEPVASRISAATLHSGG
jgi:hypothetical protein